MAIFHGVRFYHGKCLFAHTHFFLAAQMYKKVGSENEIVFMETDFTANSFVFTFAVRLTP
jgi:hypothetical protein